MTDRAFCDGQRGTYVSYADYQSSMSMYQGSKVVLFFHAPWCPDCRATDAALPAGSLLPDRIAVGVKSDYGSMTELKQKYGITQQHTFVQVDASGTALKKWTGTKDAASIKGQTL
ncbi:MAG: thioredoxin family protein [Tetrasphaera sp.]|nr:thioredoxin family protein [Tetrasphaera sp.]